MKEGRRFVPRFCHSRAPNPRHYHSIPSLLHFFFHRFFLFFFVGPGRDRDLMESSCHTLASSVAIWILPHLTSPFIDWVGWLWRLGWRRRTPIHIVRW
ncbi:hypothetical protein BO70DRAFT_12434 [Aspergillus heteromorphus CBS 117.55]|uniref:Uncharacterized protein n=1 Tax=Aspergillus heteromorphus CBS 117.55 TaxID=1448321 RepID=A0A317X4Q1_9EURO|nr:uncharacterized protein BO70DRAFT_12434 [Aspergillus heteromorphus CBS 117.55]PWY92497.1 hypothetical protein BO70DRAFT_12434 [Aspergillus heteromorphus CBS 117.55]